MYIFRQSCKNLALKIIYYLVFDSVLINLYYSKWVVQYKLKQRTVKEFKTYALFKRARHNIAVKR